MSALPPHVTDPSHPDYTGRLGEQAAGDERVRYKVVDADAAAAAQEAASMADDLGAGEAPNDLQMALVGPEEGDRELWALATATVLIPQMLKRGGGRMPPEYRVLLLTHGDPKAVLMRWAATCEAPDGACAVVLPLDPYQPPVDSTHGLVEPPPPPPVAREWYRGRWYKLNGELQGRLASRTLWERIGDFLTGTI